MLRAFSWILKLSPFRAVYQGARRREQGPFSARVLDALGIRVAIAAPDLARIPPDGPLVIVANHPRGPVDGLALLEVVRRVRPDVRILANHLLSVIPELRDECLFVDPFGGARARGRSRAGLRAASHWLKTGGALIVFPAGEVSPARNGSSPVDRPWAPGAARLAARAGGCLLPAHIGGCNSALFYAAGALHARLRTMLLPFEMLRQHSETVPVRIGEAISVTPSDGHAASMAAARQACDRLVAEGESIVDAVPAASMAAEIAALPGDAKLIDAGRYQVWCAPSALIPETLREIGRLREISFRGVGEGTGRSIDLDQFDSWYEHLFVWDIEQQQIAGAYRIGRTDVIVREHGVSGLYTRTLFRYDERLLRRMSPALELGRSFVRSEYQRRSNALLLLWRGIGCLLAREPRYRYLFGPVSISGRYQDSSRRMLMAFLRENHYEHGLGDLVHPVNPARDVGSLAGNDRCTASAMEMDRHLAAAEPDGRGIPVLLRQYLRLGAVLLGFNVDPLFSNALDALMVVDLQRVPPAILARFVMPRLDATRAA